ncbi:unnamed protein product [Adineta ricciae]|uniref:Uncharacterized protein n=1 Tax=Adineta ricciae TaxID=249248 RepID=A0A815KKT5_ADIRI|nr:unnamed protein product [Adineta ricciae]
MILRPFSKDLLAVTPAHIVIACNQMAGTLEKERFTLKPSRTLRSDQHLRATPKLFKLARANYSTGVLIIPGLC